MMIEPVVGRNMAMSLSSIAAGPEANMRRVTARRRWRAGRFVASDKGSDGRHLNKNGSGLRRERLARRIM